MTDHADLIARLRALARAEHDDLSIADEAADALSRPVTVTEEIVERMATWLWGRSGDGASWEDTHEANRHDYRLDAREAITAALGTSLQKAQGSPDHPPASGPETRPTGHVEIAHDGFAGDIIGHYTTRG